MHGTWFQSLATREDWLQQSSASWPVTSESCHQSIYPNILFLRMSSYCQTWLISLTFVLYAVKKHCETLIRFFVSAVREKYIEIVLFVTWWIFTHPKLHNLVLQAVQWKHFSLQSHRRRWWVHNDIRSVHEWCINASRWISTPWLYDFWPLRNKWTWRSNSWIQWRIRSG